MAATSRPAAPKAQFRLLGFPVRVRYGFIVFMKSSSSFSAFSLA